jgi:phosphoglucosamine mutase
MLSLAIQSGFHSAGIDTVDVGIMTAGGVSYLTAGSGANMGAIVSASHNAASENGIKFLSAAGGKLTDEDEDRIEHTLRQSGSTRVATGYLVGTRFPDPGAMDRYIDFLAGCATYTHRGLGLVVDCAHGAAYKAAPALFKKLKATVEEWGTEPDGNNINLGCGSTHPDFIAGKVKGRIGLTFDGDADRLIAVDEDGKVTNGDVILAILAKHWKAAGKLKRNVVVTTVMANLGFRRAMADLGIEVVETKVGDRYVLEAMKERRAVLGGEQSGHIICLDKGTTGDGLLTAVRLLDVVAGTGQRLADLRAEAMTQYPQVLRNVKVARRASLEDAAAVWEVANQVEEDLGEDGRILVRASGTEPLVRVMVEALTTEAARGYAERLVTVIEAELGEEVTKETRQRDRKPRPRKTEDQRPASSARKR